MSEAAADAAWVELSLPVAPRPLYDFLADVERLLRINPCVEFDRIDADPGGAWHLRGRNDSNQQPVDVRVTLADAVPGHRITLRYASGLKRETRCEIAADASGSRLTLTDVYASPAAGAHDADLREVDRSLVPWAAAIRAHVRRRRRWGWLPAYSHGERFWLAMPPRQRRLTWLLIWTTLAEFLVFLATLAIYRAA